MFYQVPSILSHLYTDFIPHLFLVPGASEGEGPAEHLVLGLVGDGHADIDGHRIPVIRIIRQCDGVTVVSDKLESKSS